MSSNSQMIYVSVSVQILGIVYLFVKRATPHSTIDKNRHKHVNTIDPDFDFSFFNKPFFLFKFSFYIHNLANPIRKIKWPESLVLKFVKARTKLDKMQLSMS